MVNNTQVMIVGNKTQTRQIHASLYARDKLPIPLDRCDLRMFERAYIIKPHKTAGIIQLL
jgi:hypothetical protein